VTVASGIHDLDSWPPLACGVDEVGRGALAGPLVAAAVVLEPGFRHPLLRDSKRLTPAQRERIEPLIRAASTAVEVVQVGPDLIDRHGIGWANRTAFEQLMSLVDTPLFLLDGNLRLSCGRPYRSVVHGDDLVPAISAASIVAKVWRDQLMRQLDYKFPVYGWAGNKGYGSARHLEAIARNGPSPLHRRSFLHRRQEPLF
jgi:ribonuclease HII